MFTEMILLGLAIASITMTVTKSNVMAYPRDQVSKLGRWAEDLAHCPYCLSHWLTICLSVFRRHNDCKFCVIRNSSIIPSIGRT
jgi:hypothetical protein